MHCFADNTIVINNLPADVTDTALLSYFKQFIHILDPKNLRVKLTKKDQNVFATFDSTDGAKNVLCYNIKS